MPVRIEAPHVAGYQPAVDDRFGGQVGFIQIAGHDRFAAHRHLADSLRVGIDDTHFHAGQRFAHRVRTEWLQVVHGYRGTSLGQSVTVGDGNSEVVEELEGLWLGERTTDDDGLQFAAERLMYFIEKPPAERESWPVFRQGLEASLEALLKILPHQWHQAYVGDLIPGKRLAHKFRTQRAQVHHCRTAAKRTKESDHEVDCMIRRQNAEVFDTRPEGIPGRKRDA